MSDDLFDSIRVKPRGAAKKPKPQTVATGICNWKGCERKATHRAPKGRGKEGEFYAFCIDHVREYNKRYNYFEGMPDEEVRDFQRDAVTGHRPTWQMGDKDGAAASGAAQGRVYSPRMRFQDPNRILGGMEAPTSAPTSAASLRARKLGKLEQRYLRTLHLTDDASPEDIKTKYKDLVKQHHPDANGGDRGSEDKLREVIQAYNYLKQAGLC